MLFLVLITLHPCVKHASICTTCIFCHCLSILFELSEPHLLFTMMCLQYFVYILFVLLQVVPLVIYDNIVIYIFKIYYHLLDGYTLCNFY